MTDAADLVAQLLDGWTERIEYAVTIPDHTPACNNLMLTLSIPELRHHECECPTRKELRADRRKQGALMTQLTEAQYSVPVTGSGGPSGGHPGSRPPGNLLRPDEILHRIASVAENLTAQAEGQVPSIVTTPHLRLQRAELLLRDIADWTPEAPPEDAREAAWALRGVVRQARVFLGYDSEWQLFADTVCGECGGALRAERSAPAEVQCAGTPAEPPCGARYPWTTWLDMVPAAPRLVDTETVCKAFGVKKGTLYSWASRGQVTRYGTPANGGALWDLSEIRERVSA